MRYRTSDLADGKARDQIGALLWQVFGLDLSAFNRFEVRGGDYCAHSFLDGDRVVANVSRFAMPMVIDGERVAAAGVQSVATLPDYRGRGLFRALMERALTDIDARYDCALLQTDQPELYYRFGFRVLEQQAFAGVLPSGSAPEAQRSLSLAEAADFRLICSLFEGRAPVSRRFGLLDHLPSFVLNALWYPNWRLTYLPEQEALVVWERSEGRTRLIDVVGRRLPDSGVIAACLEVQGEEIDLCFPPDRLDGRFSGRAASGKSVLMMRGAIPLPSQGICLPPTADF